MGLCLLDWLGEGQAVTMGADLCLFCVYIQYIDK